MTARFRLWWQQIKQHPVTVAGIIVVIFALIAFTFAVIKFGWDWTGFTSGESNRVIVNTSKGTTTAEVVQPTKTLWDWLGLLGVLAIPVVVGFGAARFTTKQRQVSEAENKDNQRENALQVYIDKMSELLLDKDNPLLDKDNPLHVSKPEDEKRIVARARTLNVLRQLNSERKGYVIQFLYESHLLSKCIIDLSFAELSDANLYQAKMSNAQLYKSSLKKANLFEADLTSANLSEVCLVGANLRGSRLCDANLFKADLTSANLRGANLRDADLRNADLSGANLHFAILSRATLIEADLKSADLSGVNLHGADLKGATGITAEELEKKAKSLKGATMPDGFKHP